MADEADVANEMIQRGLDVVLAEHAKKHDISDECKACGETIPTARQKATNGTTLCVDCASDMEKRR